MAPLPPYSGPKARIAVAEFEDKTVRVAGEISSGLRDMLVSALANSDRFQMFGSQDLKALIQEPSVPAQQGNGDQKGKIKAVDLIISVVVTDFEPQASGGNAGVGGGGGAGSSALGSLLGATSNKAHMALDIKIINISTSEVLASTRVQGEASDLSEGFTGFMKDWALGAGLSGYAGTPMEKAIRVCLIEAVRYICQATPKDYYKY